MSEDHSLILVNIKGMTIDKVSKLMGHANIKETQIYAKIIGKSLDEAMELFE